MLAVLAFDPDAFVAVSDTLKTPLDVKTCVGFRAVEDWPSPKLQSHDVGDPLETSVKLTVCPAVGLVGEYVNEATGTGIVALGAPSHNRPQP